LVDDIAANFGVVGAQSVLEDMGHWNGDRDILYPFSAVSQVLFFSSSKFGACPTRLMQFMSSYKIPLPIEPGFVSPFATGERAFIILVRVEAIDHIVDVSAGTRNLTLKITHPRADLVK
jgi:hypothetical protein